jgi:hypothetical protein
MMHHNISTSVVLQVNFLILCPCRLPEVMHHTSPPFVPNLFVLTSGLQPLPKAIFTSGGAHPFPCDLFVLTLTR